MGPRIGITSGLGGDAWRPGGSSWEPYAAAVREAGGEAVHLDPATLGRESAVLGTLQGLLFTGGLDVDLTRYPNPPDLQGEDPAVVSERFRMQPEPLRDEYEIPLLLAALDRDLPVLGICRGCQVLNVAIGGRLILDIGIEVDTPLQHPAGPPPERISSGHALDVLPGTRLAAILPPEQHRFCNSRHHQAVREDESLTARIAARSPVDGLVEAIELPDRRWAIGVQWHPEHQRDREVRQAHRPLFAAFVAASS